MRSGTVHLWVWEADDLLVDCLVWENYKYLGLLAVTFKVFCALQIHFEAILLLEKVALLTLRLPFTCHDLLEQ